MQLHSRDDASEASRPTEGLRERRRRETQRELSDAALELFETRSVSGTTVDDIAHLAGTSPRTFFRYFATKEAAVLQPTDESEAMLRAVADAVSGGEPLLGALESAWLTQISRFDAEPGEHQRVLRIRRLVGQEPTLLALALRTEAEQVDALTDTAVQSAAGTGADALSARAAIGIVFLIVRLAFDEWARRAEGGTAVSVREIYLDIRRSTVAMSDRLGDPPA
ncbi:TetR family transcriptional regulator [Microbacterium sp. NPDC077663]|uniref:TetR family transcriptional regulator n=1 Tax=Microbacterium sp. NPDC077663 TaxID=3364189 RepID=UPI0037CA9AE0